MESKKGHDRIHIKICGLFRSEDIIYVNEARPDYAGFIVNYKKSHRYVPPDTVIAFKKMLHSDIRSVGVYVDEDIANICKLYETGALDVIQLHGHEDNAYIHELRRHIPGAVIWKAFKIRQKSDIIQCMDSDADMVLLDNGYGTGRAFNWDLINNMNRPYILAGGLTADMICDAAKRLNPWGIDISSGAETDGVKDRDKIISVVTTANACRKGVI